MIETAYLLPSLDSPFVCSRQWASQHGVDINKAIPIGSEDGYYYKFVNGEWIKTSLEINARILEAIYTVSECVAILGISRIQFVKLFGNLKSSLIEGLDFELKENGRFHIITESGLDKIIISIKKENL